jgi:nucleoside-diphosphate-sugar epimerase
MNAYRQPVLCTGAAGFIGSHLVRALRDRGHDVWGLLGPNDEPGPDAPPGVHWVRGDLTRPDTLGELHRAFETVYHLAALLTTDRADRYFAVNFEGTRNLAEAVLAAGQPQRLVFASSLAASGPAPGSAGLSEDDLCRPVCNYGRSKRMAELYLDAIATRIPSTIVRLPLVYGPGSYGGLFAYFRMVRTGFCLVGGRTKAVTVGYVEDIVRGLMIAADSASSAGETYFLGESRAYRVPEIIAAIEAAEGKRALRVHIPYTVGYCGAALIEAVAAARGAKPTVRRQELDDFLRFSYWTADTTKAAREIGFQATVTLAEGTRMTADWYLRMGTI